MERGRYRRILTYFYGPAAYGGGSDLNMKKLVFITGGARSGKSRYAQTLALQHSGQPVYVATARIWDEDFRQRVDRHRQDRDARWTSMEEEKQLSKLPLQGRTVVIDCVTLWITNFFPISIMTSTPVWHLVQRRSTPCWNRTLTLSSSATRSGWDCIRIPSRGGNLRICRAG